MMEMMHCLYFILLFIVYSILYHRVSSGLESISEDLGGTINKEHRHIQTQTVIEPQVV